MDRGVTGIKFRSENDSRSPEVKYSMIAEILLPQAGRWGQAHKINPTTTQNWRRDSGPQESWWWSISSSKVQRTRQGIPEVWHIPCSEKVGPRHRSWHCKHERGDLRFIESEISPVEAVEAWRISKSEKWRIRGIEKCESFHVVLTQLKSHTRISWVRPMRPTFSRPCGIKT